MALAVTLLAGCRTPERERAPATDVTAASEAATSQSPASPRAAPGADASVWRVIDGDTVELVVDTGYDATERAFERVRIRGIDTPEHHASSKLDRDAARSALDRETIRALGKAATSHAAFLLPLGTVVTVDGTERDRYGRLVAYLAALDAAGQPFDVGARMIADGFAHAYDGGGRYPHARMDHYRALERIAREQGRGLWDSDADAASRLSQPQPRPLAPQERPAGAASNPTDR